MPGKEFCFYRLAIKSHKHKLDKLHAPFQLKQMSRVIGGLSVTAVHAIKIIGYLFLFGILASCHTVHMPDQIAHHAIYD